MLIFPAEEWEHFLYVGKVSFVGWMLHYVPFLIMGRVTYIHHYVSWLHIVNAPVLTNGFA